MQPQLLECFFLFVLANPYLLLLCAIHDCIMLQLLQQLRSLRHCN
jgi:hypothetical protein